MPYHHDSKCRNIYFTTLRMQRKTTANIQVNVYISLHYQASLYFVITTARNVNVEKL